MALATDSNKTSASPGPGLGTRVAEARAGLASVVAELDPERLLGADAASLYAELARVERLVVAGKTLLAPRIADSGYWETEGHRSPASLLASLEGGSAGQARRTLETGQRLTLLPSTEAALRTGRLSGPKVAEISEAAALDPTAESNLLDEAEHGSLRDVKERCQRVRATSARHDPVAAIRRIHAARHFTSWTDAEGAFCYQGRDTAERGALLASRLTPLTNRLKDARRAASRADGAPAPAPEPEAALRADALFALLTGRSTASRAAEDDAGAGDDATDGDTDTDTESHRLDAASLVETPSPTTVIVRVDLAALRRGHAVPGEVCELDGHGPIPVRMARDLASDAFLALVFSEAGDIRAVSHLGRTINKTLRTALAVRDRHCVVPGCGVAYGLEIDHVLPMEEGGATTLDNLALLCHHHHFLKTYEGWVLARGGPTDEDPGWSFAPQPPFGQEPGLGIDGPARPPPGT